MTSRVALFRGINVGGHNRIPMAELRDTFESLGCLEVRTIIQTGNVCFDGGGPDAVMVEAIRAAVATRFEVDVPVLLRTRTDIENLLDAHPFDPGSLEPKFHHVMFLAGPPPSDAAARIGDHSPDEFAVIGREIHVRYPEGSARSALTVALVDRALSAVATARNLPTVEKLAVDLSRRS